MRRNITHLHITALNIYPAYHRQYIPPLYTSTPQPPLDGPKQLVPAHKSRKTNIEEGGKQHPEILLIHHTTVRPTNLPPQKSHHPELSRANTPQPNTIESTQYIKDPTRHGQNEGMGLEIPRTVDEREKKSIPLPPQHRQR